MTQVNKENSRIIETSNGSVYVDTSDALLVDEAMVVSKFDGQDDPWLAVEVHGKVNLKDESGYVLTLIKMDEVPTLVMLLVEGLMQQSPVAGRALVESILALGRGDVQ